MGLLEKHLRQPAREGGLAAGADNQKGSRPRVQQPGAAAQMTEGAIVAEKAGFLRVMVFRLRTVVSGHPTHGMVGYGVLDMGRLAIGHCCSGHSLGGQPKQQKHDYQAMRQFADQANTPEKPR